MRDCFRCARLRGVLVVCALGVFVLRGSLAGAAPLTITPSIGLAETLTDNVFFDDQDEQDAITRLGLYLLFSYQTESSTTSLSAGTSAAYRARTSSATIDLGEAQRLGLSTGYEYSPRLQFAISNSLGRLGSRSRDQQFIDNPLPVTGANAPIENDPAGNNPSGVNWLLPSGDAFSNSFASSATYLTAPLWSTSVTYTNGFAYFSDRETTDANGVTTSSPNVTNLSQYIALGLNHQYTPTLTLHGDLGYAYFYSDDAPDSDNYSLRFGPSWALASLWNVSGLVGASLNRTVSTGDLRATADVALDISRSMENSLASAGISNGFTPSAGVAGTSQTLTTYLSYSRRLTEWFVGSTWLTYSRFNTDSTDFDVLTVRTGVFYPIWRNISGSLNYAYRRQDSDEPLAGVSDAGVIDANVLSLQFTWSNPLWQLDL